MNPRRLRELIRATEIVIFIGLNLHYLNFILAIILGLIEFAVIEILADYASDMVLFGEWRLPIKIKEYFNNLNDR